MSGSRLSPIYKLTGSKKSSNKFAMKLDNLWNSVQNSGIDKIKKISKIIFCIEPLNYSQATSADNEKTA